MRLRTARGLSQIELTRQTGIEQNKMSDYGRNRTRLNAHAMILICKALDVSVDELLGLETRRTRNLVMSRGVLRRAAKLEALPPAMKKRVLRTIDMLLKSAEKWSSSMQSRCRSGFQSTCRGELGSKPTARAPS